MLNANSDFCCDGCSIARVAALVKQVCASLRLCVELLSPQYNGTGTGNSCSSVGEKETAAAQAQ